MQKHEIIQLLMRQYGKKTPINEHGLDVLYSRAESRGYRPAMIYMGLRTVICKNYLRKEYEPPNGNPENEPIHERVYIEDWEFQAIMKGWITQ